MKYKLSTQNGKVRYIAKMKNQNVGSDTSIGTALWLLEQNKPFQSDEFPGYPVAVTTPHGDQYFFAGEWVQSDKPQKKPSARKRRIKDIVLE